MDGPDERIVSGTFAALDHSLRKASIAELGGFRPPETVVTSWFGGRFVGTVDETWALNDGEPMLPLLQVRTDELPHVPPQLSNIALFNIFVGPRKLPTDLPSPNGRGWLIRSYNTLDGLRALSDEPVSHVRPLPIRWSLAKSDAPGWEDACTITDLSSFNELPDAIELFYNRYQGRASTKVGGWPTFIQGAPGLDSDHFVFQIGSEKKSKWMWGDNGIGYFYFDDGEWMLHCDCY